MEPTTALLAALAEALASRTFVKLTLSKPRRTQPALPPAPPSDARRGDAPQQAFGRVVELKGGSHLSLLLRHPSRDVTINHPLSEGARVVAGLLERAFENAHLFTTTADFELRTNKKGVARLSRHAATFNETPSVEHDRVKRYVLDPAASPYLAELGIASPDGHIKSDKVDKYRQMQSIVKILDDVVLRSKVLESARNAGRRLRVVDIGCGKGYLTFALYDYFNRHLGIPTDVVGVDRNAELMALCNGVATRVAFDQLRFTCSDVDEFDIGDVDVLVALHACDTATDLALFKGVAGGAAIVLAVPCCQKELRPQLKVPRDELPLLKHDTFKDRYSQMLTDAMRGLLMETQGYQTRVIEFISDAHTHRNVMIVANRGQTPAVAGERQAEVTALKARYRIVDQHLETLLSQSGRLGAEP